jgi:hypothetical protein
MAPCARDGLRAATDRNWPKYARQITDAAQDFALTPEGALLALKSSNTDRCIAAKLADGPLMTKLSTVCADWLKARHSVMLLCVSSVYVYLYSDIYVSYI